MGDIFSNNALTIENVQNIMKKLSCQLSAAKLRHHTHLEAKKSNVKKYSSTYETLKSLVEIREFLPLLDIADIFISITGDAKVDSVLVTLSNLDFITEELQK